MPAVAPDVVQPRRSVLKLSLTITLAALGISLLAIFVAGAPTADAAVCSLTAGAGLSWNQATNWSCGHVPGSIVGDTAQICTSSVNVDTILPNGVILDMFCTTASVNIPSTGRLQIEASSLIGSGGNTVTVNGGTLVLNSGSGLSNMQYAIVLNSGTASNSGIYSTGPSFTQPLTIAGGTFTNTGTMNFAGATISQSAGTLTNSNLIKLLPASPATTMNWSGGTLNGAGALQVQTGATPSILNFNAPGGAILSQQVIPNAGTINYAPSAGGPLTINSGGGIDNTGSFFLANDTAINSDGTGLITNTGGTITKSGGAGTSNVNVAVNNNGTITFGPSLTNIALNNGGTHGGTFAMPLSNQFLFAGTHNFGAGSAFTGSGPVTIAGGIFQANTGLTIPGGLTNNGSLKFGGATQTLTVNGNYTQGGAAAFSVRLNGAGTFDQMSVSGAANLAGTLNATLGFTPADGQTWNIVTDSSVSGDFSTKNLPPYARGIIVESPAPPTGPVTLVAVPQSDIAVTKGGPASVLNGQNATFTVTVSNLGPATPANVNISDSFSAGWTFVSATPSTGSCIGTGPINCNFPALAMGTPATVSVVLKATTPGSQTNTASLSSTTPPEPPAAGGNNTQTATVTVNPAADLAVTSVIGAPNPVSAGGSETWSITVSNLGPDPAASVTVNLSLSAGTFTGPPSGGGFTCSNTPTTANCTIASLASGANPAITASTTAPIASGTMTMTAVAGSSTGDPVAGNNSNSGTVTVNASADVGVSKTGPAFIDAGQNITYTITVGNTGPSTATSITLTDPTPPGLTLVSVSGACTTLPCTIASIPSPGTATINVTFSVPSNAAAGTITNIATVSSANDPNPANDSSTATTTIFQKADLSVTKSGPASAATGSNITYTIIVTNSGPSDAAGVKLDDSYTPAGRLMFVSSTGGCASFPCLIGTMVAGASKTFTLTYTVQPGPPGPIVNTATVSATTTDPNSGNNSASVTTSTGGCPSGAPTNLSPPDKATNVPTTGTLSWSNVNADTYTVSLDVVGPNGSCSKFFVSTSATSVPYSGLQPNTTYQWHVDAMSAGCTKTSTSCQTFTTAGTGPNCPPPPTLISPINMTVTGAATFSWSAVPGAIDYTLFVNGAAVGTTTATSLGPINIGTGPVTWHVVARLADPCGQLTSQDATFDECNIADPPLPAVVASSASGQGYDLIITNVIGSTRAEADESTDPNFTAAATNTQTSTNLRFHFQHTVTVPTAFYYRVRAFLPCANRFTANSVVVPVVIAPAISPTNPNLPVPFGNTGLVDVPVHIPGLVTGPFTVNINPQSRLKSVRPSSGFLGSDGVDLIASLDITGLPPGTFSLTLFLDVTTPSSGAIRNQGVTPVGAAVSVSLVTPVIPKPAGTPPQNALIIPSVGHLDGINSHWQSDIRVANVSQQSVKYQLTFTPDDVNKGVKQTIIDVAAGNTTALDDIVKTWYGIGALGETANGVLEIRPVDSPGKGTPANNDVSVTTTAVASSRAYNVTSQGTLGQFIPALPFSGFIGRAVDQAHAATVLGLQQIAQNDAFRTNVGVVEASGQPVSVLISAFDSNGTKLLDFPLDLKAGEQRQLNSFLAQNRITLSDGRIEVKVTGGEGKITTYASVVDNKSGDPLLVSGIPLGQNPFDHFVLPGVADLNTGFAAWRTDMRIFNPTTTPQFVTLNFYAQNSSAAPQMTSMTINPGEVKKLDNTLASFFGLTNVGGAVHVTTNSASPLVITGRTYNLTSNGTFGQFIPAVTSVDAVGKSDRGLQILQVEDSIRYRTNLGIAEVTGKPATVEVQVVLPDSKIAPSTQIPLPANGFVQVPVIQSLGLNNVYNARISLRVVDGDGKVSAYGSVIDQRTQDPTYVPAQK